MAEEEKAVTSPKDNKTPGETQTEDVQKLDKSSEQNPETDSPEVENDIVLSGDAGSQPKDESLGVRKRINKLNAKVSAANDETSQASQDLALERERSKLLQLALDQKTAQTELPQGPNPDDFDEGVNDRNYIAAQRRQTQEDIQSELKRHTDQIAAAQPKPDVSQELLRRQERHYKRASELGTKDFNETEDIAIGVLGKAGANYIIQKSDKSSEVLYYLGKNPDEAHELVELSRTDEAKALMKIGRLEALLVAQPKAKAKPPPNPDEELEGSTQDNNTFNVQLERERKKVMSGESKNMDGIIALKKKALEVGVKL